jgi:glycine/D-amino acid oxidase-like deaminating enzyme/nitrite reductase/ring-hydroxylating ferredoxin subunit
MRFAGGWIATFPAAAKGGGMADAIAELESKSYWLDSAGMKRFGSLDRDLTVDVAVVGAGITGLTAAYLLKRAGQKVAVIDRQRAGGVDSMNTTAHLTCVTDADLTTLVKDFGRDHARAVWDAGLAAILEIDAIRSREEIDCHFDWVRGYKFAALTANAEDEARRLQQEAALAAELGFDARFLDAVPLFERPGVEIEGQARFHPRKYLSALTSLIDGDGSHVFEHTESEEVCDNPLSVKANGHTISCGYVVIATHTPLMGKTNLALATLFQSKLFLYSSYVLGGRAPKGGVPDALFWDTADPYNYLRIDARRDVDYVIFGGKDHKTGQANDTEARYRSLENTLKQVVPQVEITHRWSAQVIETQDGLPYIGETSSRQFAATGYAGNGMTFGTLAGMMARDAVLGRRNPWDELFDTGRTKIKGGVWDYLKENADYPYYMIRDRIVGPEAKTLREVGRGAGKIVNVKGQKVAAYRSEAGSVTLLSPVCTHMGCHVDWNEAESTWDCPCHGSRFKPTGEVLSGPAESPLQKVQ